MKRRGRISHRDKLLENNAALRFYGVPLQNEIKPRRVRKRDDGSSVDIDAIHRKRSPLERDVLKTIVAALRLDPRVASVERNQSGVFQDGDRHIRVGSRGKLDLTVYLKSGRYAEIEVKRDASTKPRPEQEQRIAEIRRSGGIAGWCWSIESALAILP